VTLDELGGAGSNTEHRVWTSSEALNPSQPDNELIQDMPSGVWAPPPTSTWCH